MTPHAPTPAASSPASTRVRVKWENVMIVLIGIVVAVFACVAILLGGLGSAATTGTKPSTRPATEPAVDPAPVADGTLSIDDARGLVDEARALMTEARWDEALERLALVPEDMREVSGATSLGDELTPLMERHTDLRSQIDAAVEARRWKEADLLLTEIATIAPLDQPLLAQQAIVREALMPEPAAADSVTTPGATRRPATDSTATGGGTAGATTDQTATAAKPAATPKPKPKPASTGATTRPKPATTPTTGPTQPTTGAGSSTGTGTEALLPSNLTDGLTAAEQAQLEQALGAALGDIQ